MTAEFAKGTDRIKGLNFTDPVQAVKQVIRQIDGRVDAIVLVAHMGIDNENQRPGTGVADIANANPELAAIVAGHMHVKIDKAVVNGVIITEPDKYGRALSRIDLQFERRDGKFTLIDKTATPIRSKDWRRTAPCKRSTSRTMTFCAPMPTGSWRS